MLTATDPLVFAVERANARAEVALAEELKVLRPRTGIHSEPVAGGWIVIGGPGLYVNRAMAMGLGVSASPPGIEAVVAASRGAGVPPEIEISPLAHPSLLELAVTSRFAPAWFRSVFAVDLNSYQAPESDESDVQVIEMAGAAGVTRWTAAMARAFAITEPDRLQVLSDYVEAQSRTGMARLFLASTDGADAGVGTLVTCDGIATFGGMVTSPEFRNRGVQTALIRRRLDEAKEAGTPYAATTAEPGGGSERNLRRSGFSVLNTKVCMRRS